MICSLLWVVIEHMCFYRLVKKKVSNRGLFYRMDMFEKTLRRKWIMKVTFIHRYLVDN